MSASDSFSTQLAFNDITDTTRQLLAELHPMLMGAIPGILDEFYAFLEGFPEVNRFFATPAIKAHAKAAQIAHWDHLLSAKFDETYHHSAIRIGETHHRLGLEPQWYIGAYRRLLSGVIRHIEVGTTSRFAGRAFYEKKAAMIDALLKAVMLDMNIIIALYLDAGKRERMSTLQRLSDQFEESVGQIAEDVAAHSEELKTAADDLKNTASNTQLLSTTVASASEQASASVRSVATGTEHLGSSVAEISQQVQESLLTSNDAVAQAESANGQIAELSQAASRIGDVVKIISSIAEQTNLLALNATIEAARAGEAGKGFAVVAHEVKQLATQTAKATQEISVQINDMQTSTGAAVEAILAIGKTIDSVSKNSQAIHDAVNRQNTATREITHNINTAASGSAEVAATISNVNQGAEATKTAAGSVHTSADKLTGESQKLRAEVNNFLATLRSA